MKCSDILVLLVRDAAHITPYNFDSCVHAIRVFVEASMKSATQEAEGPFASDCLPLLTQLLQYTHSGILLQPNRGKRHTKVETRRDGRRRSMVLRDG